MIILADENIPNVKQSFAAFGEVKIVSGRDINAAMLTNVDVLLVRSVTPVNEQLLTSSQVKFVGSATTGTDHVDMNYLSEASIYFTHAHGANARSVTEYVLAVLAQLYVTRHIDFFDKTVGIIGLGKVGGGLYNALTNLDISCIGYDPLIAQDSYANMVTLDEVMQADIVCVHTPLTNIGEYPTSYMLDEKQLLKLKQGAVLINAGRGEVVDNQALLKVYNTNSQLITALDVWEHEPAIHQTVLAQVDVATAHIAGYSLDGKFRATQMLKDSFCDFFQVESDIEPLVKVNCLELDVELTGEARDVVCRAILAAYPIIEDDQQLRNGQTMNDIELAAHFDSLRKNYWPRREFSQYTVLAPVACPDLTKKMLAACGFNLVSKGN
ncbi:MAG: erythronate-4-phosphate dehydrogenase [Pseudomonadales bacterium]